MAPTILVVHGFGSSGEIAETLQTVNLHKALVAAGYNVKYPTAPFKLKLEDIPWTPRHDINKYDLHAWWYLKGNHSLAETHEYIKSLNDPENPIVGYIGLSQGGSLGSIIAANYKEWIPTLKFVIAHGGFLYPGPLDEPDSTVYKNKISIPFLTIVGEADEVVLPERSIRIADEVVEPGKSTIYRHHGGHIFADDEKSVKTAIEWIKSVDK